MILLCVFLSLITPLTLLSQINAEQINNFVSNWKYYWETEDIYKIDYFLSPDYEYYGINSENNNKIERLNKIKKIFKENDNIKVNIENITIDKSSSTDNDVKVVFNQTVTGSNINENNLITLRLFKGKETKNVWKIYKEFSDKSDKTVKSKNDADSSFLSPFTLILILILFVVFLVIFIQKYGKSKCPNCKRGFARIFTGSKPIKSEGGYSTVNRTDRVENPKDFNDVKYIHRTEQVHVVRTWYDYYWKCKYCDHAWKTLGIKEREG
jgi:hypothetical protein